MGYKARVNLTIDGNLWESVRDFFADNPQMGSVSGLVEMTLREFMEVMPDMVARARAGDSLAALAILQRSHNSRTAEISLGLNELQATVLQQPVLIQSQEETKSKRVSKQKK
jgi:hypothetical protein